MSEYAHDADMSELVLAFVAELPDRVRALEEAWSGRRRDVLARMAHQLKGAGAGYGYPALGRAAADLEEALSTGPAGKREVPAQAEHALNHLLELCRRVRAG